ncbi:MAG: putative transposase, partial [Caballeronia sp.]|nr:putative transposase [Caballeronia sp.]
PYSIRSERMLMERISYNMFFRWFVGLPMDGTVWDHSTFSKNPDRLLEHNVLVLLFNETVETARERGYLSGEPLCIGLSSPEGGQCPFHLGRSAPFEKILRSNPVPRKIVTDQLRSYPAAKADIPELAHVKHVLVKAAARVKNRAENSHQPTRRRERQICGFRDARRTQAFLSCFGPIRQHFALPRHQMNAACHRAVLQERLATWHGWTVTSASQKAI